MDIRHIYKYTSLPAGQICYYSSAKFRELQLDRLLMGEPMEHFPTDANFFLSDYKSAIVYSTKVENYGNNTDRQHFDVTHVYRVKRETKLLDLMDIDNIRRLLYEDPSSPFHISKAHISVGGITSAGDILSIVRNTRDGRTYIYDNGLTKDNLVVSGYLLLTVATNYGFTPSGPAYLTRYSNVRIDYIIAELMSSHAMDYDGWYQPAQKGGFHMEWMFFRPSDVLEPFLDHPASWHQQLIAHGWNPDMKLHQKEVLRLDLVGQWRKEEESELLNNLKQMQARLASLKKDGTNSKYYKEELKELDDPDLTVSSLIRNYLYETVNIKRKIKEVKTTMPTTYSLALKLKLMGCDSLPPRDIIQKHVNRHLLLPSSQHKITCFNECQFNLDNLAREMEKYKNANNIHHRGLTVSDHSIWVTRAMHRWLGFVDHPWTVDITDRNVALIAAFMHDIGKIGDTDTEGLKKNTVKPDHPIRGYEYMLNWSQFKTADGVQSSLIDDIINMCSMNPWAVATVATVAALHHHFGELVMALDRYPISMIGNRTAGPDGQIWKIPTALAITEKKYIEHPLLYNNCLLSKLLDTIHESKYIIFYFDFLLHFSHASGDIHDTKGLDQTLRILMAISAADVYGAHPVEDKGESIYDASLAKLLDPSILHHKTRTHDGRQYPEIFRPYYQYLYYTNGIREKNTVLAYAATVVDRDNFLEGWTGFSKLLSHIENPAKAGLPAIFRSLDVTSTESFVRDLFRLLKSGEVSSSGAMIKSLPIGLTDALKDTSLNPVNRDLIRKFNSHRHQELRSAEF